MRKFISGAALAIGALALGIAGVNATTYDTKQLTVQVGVIGTCAIGSFPAALNFAALTANQPTTQDQTAVAYFGVVCSGTYNLSADAGQNAGGDITKRAMKSSASSDLISYNLYTDGTYKTIWGNTPGTNTISSTGTGSIPFYGKLPSGTTPKDTVTYTDVVTITLTN